MNLVFSGEASPRSILNFILVTCFSLVFSLLHCIGIPGTLMVAVDSSRQCANVFDAAIL